MPGIKRFLVEKINIPYNISIFFKKYYPYVGNNMLSIRFIVIYLFLSLMKYITSVCHKIEHKFMKYEPSISKCIKNNTTSYSIVIPKTSSFIYNFYQVVHETWFYLLFFLERERERERESLV